jgi:hypothetical protein
MRNGRRAPHRIDLGDARPSPRPGALDHNRARHTTRQGSTSYVVVSRVAGNAEVAAIKAAARRNAERIRIEADLKDAKMGYREALECRAKSVMAGDGRST